MCLTRRSHKKENGLIFSHTTTKLEPLLTILQTGSIKPLRLNSSRRSLNKSPSKSSLITIRDINRTFHTSRVTTPEGQRELRRLLMATAFSNFYIGYCQGMNFLAATILSIVKDEAKAYLIFQGLLYSKDVYEIYYPRVPGLHLRDYQLE